MAETFNSLAYMLGPFVVDVMYARGQMFESVIVMTVVMWTGVMAILLCPKERKGMSLSEGTIRSMAKEADLEVEVPSGKSPLHS